MVSMVRPDQKRSSCLASCSFRKATLESCCQFQDTPPTPASSAAFMQLQLPKDGKRSSVVVSV